MNVTTNIHLSPEQVAAAFWSLDNFQQADFFAALDRIAGLSLCFQMVNVVNVMQRRAARGERDAMHGFQTMLSHAQGFAESSASFRAEDAKRTIAAIAEQTP